MTGGLVDPCFIQALGNIHVVRTREAQLAGIESKTLGHSLNPHQNLLCPLVVIIC